MKKKLLTLLAIGIIPTMIFSKNIAQGKIEVKGDVNLNFSSAKYDSNGKDIDVDNTELSFVGLYYIIPNLGLGLNWNYETSEVNNVDSSESTIGPMVAYNISLGNKLSVKLFGGIGFISGEENNVDHDGSSWQMGTSLNYFIRDNISLNSSLLYGSRDIDVDNGIDYEITGFNTAVGLSVYF
jgi:hypothetical protein